MELTNGDRAWLAAQRLPLALVFNAHGNGLGIARSLGTYGVPVAVLSPQRDLATESRYSRWLQSPAYSSAHFIPFLEQIGEVLPQPGVLYPLQDHLVELCVIHRRSLSHYYHLSLPTPRAFKALSDKGELLTTAKAVGVDTPTSRIGGPLPANFPLPAIVKPLAQIPEFKTRYGQKILRFSHRQELEANLEQMESFRPLIQAFIPGDEANLWTYGAAFLKGLPLAEYTGRKLIQYPPGAGDAAVAESVWEPSVAAVGRRLLRSVNYSGMAQVEFKVDPKGTLRLLEVNPRAWSWNSLPTASGSNLSLALYAALLNKSLPSELRTQRETHLRWRYGRLWLLATLRLLLEGRPSRDVLALGRGQAINAILTQGDWGPLPLYLSQIVKTFLGEFALKARNFQPR